MMRTPAIVLGILLVAAAVVLTVQRWPRVSRDSSTISTSSIVMLGDSITENGDWATLLPDLDVVNRGESGFTSAQLVAVGAAVADARPAVVFILTGTNDIRDDHPPTWTAQYLTEILDRFETDAPDTRVVLQTVLPRADAVEAVLAVNEAIRGIASRRGTELLDLHPVFDDGSGALRPAETVDGIHLAEPGYRRWARSITEVLDAIA